MTVAFDPSAEVIPLRYEYLEIIRNRVIVQNHGKYDSYVKLDSHVRVLINWWISNVDVQVKALRSCPHQLKMYADAYLVGVQFGEMHRQGGHWAHEELDHINCLEVKFILVGLKSLCKDSRGTHIRLRSDNATAVACI